MKLRRSGRIIGAALGLTLAGASGAGAQSASSTLSNLSRGFGVSASSLESPVAPVTHDSSGTTNFIYGVLQPPSGSLFGAVPSPALTGGVGASTSSSGGPTTSVANAAAARLDVVTPKAGAPTPTSALVLNGKVDLDGGL